MTSVLEKVYQFSISQPDNKALIFENEYLTYKELWDNSLKLSNYLERRGVKKGDRILVQSCYAPAFFVACYASWLCHAIFVPVDADITEEKIKDVCSLIEPQLVLTKEDFFSNYEKIIKEEQKRISFTFPEDEDWSNIIFTTGTTGASKGVIWSHRSIAENCQVKKNLFFFDNNSRDLLFVPLNHAAPLWRVFSLHYFGGASVLIDGLIRLPQIYNAIKSNKVSSVYTAPSSLSIIEKLAPEIFTDFQDQIKFVSIGSASITENQKLFILDALPKTQILFCYASSETGYNAVLNLRKSNSEPNCVGKPLPDIEVKIEETVLIKSRLNFSGYWKNSQLTAQSFKDGYFITNDLGYFDSDGNLFICGRSDDVINIGGLKVLPSEIENVVMKLPWIQDCICFAVPDKTTNQAACLLIEAEKKCSLTEVREHLKNHLDSYKVPKFIEFTDQIAKTSNGKPDRKLQAELWKIDYEQEGL